MIQQPECLHIPILFTGGEAHIRWDDIPEATSYELWANTDGEAALATGEKPGYTWAQQRKTEFSWADFAVLGPEENGYTWAQLMLLYAPPEYQELGYNWGMIKRTEITWEQFNTLGPAQNGYPWKQLELLYARDGNWVCIYRGEGNFVTGEEPGYTWAQMERAEINWAEYPLRGPAGNGYTWLELAGLYLPDNKWEFMNAKCWAWANFEQHIYSWNRWHSLPADAGDHRTYTWPIPEDAQNIVFRIRALGKDEPSEYLLTTAQPVIKETKENISFGLNDTVFMQLNAEDNPGTAGECLTVLYDANYLTLENSAEQAAHSAREGQPGIRPRFCGPGRLKFTGTVAAEQGMVRTGLATKLRFKTKRAGSSTLTLQQQKVG